MWEAEFKSEELIILVGDFSQRPAFRFAWTLMIAFGQIYCEN
jgi:hypothetical protein